MKYQERKKAGKGHVRSQEPMTSSDLWHSFKKNTTVHGIPHVYRAVGDSKKCVWFIISMVAVGWLTYHLYFICSLFFSFGTNVKVTILNENTMVFPAVTLCNLNAIKKSALGMESVIESLLGDDTSKKKRRKRYTDSSPVCLPTDLFQESTGLCYRLFNDKKVKLTGGHGTKADDLCLNLGGSVYMPTSQEKVDFMNATDLFTNNSVDSYWNWMRDNKWGHVYDLSYASYTNWNPLYSTGYDSSHSVVSDSHRWHSKKRDKKEHVTYTLCQDMVQCPHTPYDPDRDGIGFCWFMPLGNQALNAWLPSSEFCQIYDANARLIQLDSQAKTDYFVKHSGVLDGVMTNETNEYWLGYKGGYWYTETGWPIASWTNFAPDATVNFPSSGPAMAYINLNHTWRYGLSNDRSQSKAMVICEIDLPTTIFTTEQPTTIEPTTIQPTTTEEATTEIPTTTTTTPKPTTKVPSTVEGRLPLKESFILQETVVENLAIISEETKSKMGYAKDEFILDCTYEGSTCSFNEFTKFYSPVLGNCYIFNSGWNSSKTVYKARKTGRLYGLSVVLNIGEAEYVKKLGGASGARVVITGQNEMPHPEEEGILVEPGKVVSIGLRKVSLERLSHPYGNCTELYKDEEIDVFSEKYPVKYSAKDCKKTCYQKKLMESCLCADSRYPSHGKALGGQSTHPCDTRNVIEDDCRYLMNNAFISGELGCDDNCYDICSESYHTFDLSIAKWPSAAHKEKLIEDFQGQLSSVNLSESDTMESNLLTVEVFYQDFSSEEIREIPAYNMGQFASDVGGILGLWVGMSVITIFEFIELGADLMLLRCAKLCKKQLKQKQTFSGSVNAPSTPPDIAMSEKMAFCGEVNSRNVDIYGNKQARINSNDSGVYDVYSGQVTTIKSKPDWYLLPQQM